MKLGLLAAASIAALTVGSGTASAQYLVPHRDHYHVVSPPIYGGYGCQPFSPQMYGGGFGYQSYSPRIVVGGFYSSGFGGGYNQPSFGYGGGYRQPSYGYGGGYGNYGHNHRHR